MLVSSVFAFLSKRSKDEEKVSRAVTAHRPKLQALVYDIFSPTTAITDYAIGSRKTVS